MSHRPLRFSYWDERNRRVYMEDQMVVDSLGDMVDYGDGDGEMWPKRRVGRESVG